MDKKQLIEYLDAVCDAESAVQACEEMIDVYVKQSEYQLPSYKEPEEPRLLDLDSDFYRPGFHREEKFAFEQKHRFDKYRIWYTSEKEAQRLRANAETHNRELLIRHNEKLAIYHYHCKLQEAYIVQCNTEMQNGQMKLRNAKASLAQLYCSDIFYPSFRNLIAAYQIREYLQMGICDTLEGPTGAYAQYMNDVRAARICESITDLKRSLTAAISGLQGTLARELRQIDSNLDCIRSDMNTSVQRFNAQMQQMHTASAAQLDAHFSEANRQLSAISNNLAISEHNRYIERRLNKVDTYLMKLP